MNLKHLSLALVTCFALVGCNAQANDNNAPSVHGTVHIVIDTSMGEMRAELFGEQAPITVANFVGYIEEGFFDQLIFHRVIDNFMVQGGGFNSQMEQKAPSQPAIRNEASNGLLNHRGTLSMARTNDPHSATSQFFINLIDNGFLNYSNSNPGYAVFGQLTAGLDVLDSIAKVETTSRRGHRDVPDVPVIINSIRVLDSEDDNEADSAN